VSAAGYRLIIVLALLVGLVLIGAAAFMALEDLSFLDALYFAVVTISTVGYGDVTPATSGGKVLSIALIVLGVGTFLTVTANAVQLLLQRRQERIRTQRLRMVIGVFFSELGTQLLHRLTHYDPDIEPLRHELLLKPESTEQDFDRLRDILDAHVYNIDPPRMKLEELRDFLEERGNTLLQTLDNPNLYEHEAFTELLRATFHLREELLLRPRLLELPAPDVEHLAGDCRRIYSLLARQWLSYLRYLRASYPFLFSLALRTNPFSREPSPIVTT
jgi:voltage-gated potassium channel